MTASRSERHLDSDATGSPLAHLPGLAPRTRDTERRATQVVVVIVGPDAVSTPRGQLLVWVTVNLLLRCYGAVDAVIVHSVDTRLLGPLPTLIDPAGQVRGPDTMHQALTDLATATAQPGRRHPRLMLASQATTTQPVNAIATLLIGRELATGGISAASPHMSGVDTVTSGATWLLTASAWKAAVISAASIAQIDPASLPDLNQAGASAVGAWFAATVGCAEAFKAVGDLRPGHGRYIDVLSADLWNGVIADGLDALAGDDGPRTRLELPAHYLVGAGAVGAAYLSVLSTSGVNTDVAVVEHDVLDHLNLNRHIIAGWGDIGAQKAAIAYDRLSNTVTRIVPIPFTWQAWVAKHPNDKPALPVHLKADEQNGRYDLVVSAVDKDEARTALAAARPSMIFGASTNGMTVEVGRYGVDSPWQCLGCASQMRDPAKTVEDAAAELSGMTATQLEAAADAAGVDVEVIRQYLTHPVCGTLGEREVARFATSTRPDWSVSFVSVAAATLLAARVLRHAQSAGIDRSPVDARLRGYPTDGDTVRMWMLTATFGRAAHKRRHDCPICAGVTPEGKTQVTNPLLVRPAEAPTETWPAPTW